MVASSYGRRVTETGHEATGFWFKCPRCGLESYLNAGRKAVIPVVCGVCKAEFTVSVKPNKA